MSELPLSPRVRAVKEITNILRKQMGNGEEINYSGEMGGRETNKDHSMAARFPTCVYRAQITTNLYWHKSGEKNQKCRKEKKEKKESSRLRLSQLKQIPRKRGYKCIWGEIAMKNQGHAWVFYVCNLAFGL